MATFAAAVLAAGNGTRMKSQTPKVLHHVCGKEMVRLVVDAARAAGVRSVTAVVPKDSQAIRDALGETVEYAVQPRPLGSGEALLRARQALGEADNVLVLYGDVPLIFSDTLRRLVKRHNETEACVTILTSTLVPPDGLGRIVRSADGGVSAIVEESMADEETKAIVETNSGCYCFRASWLWDALECLAPSSEGEVFLTDLVAEAYKNRLLVESVQSEDEFETLGVNNRIQLAKAEEVLRQRIRDRWMLGGVTMQDPSSIYIDEEVELGQDTVILPNTHITGRSKIGNDCRIGPNSVINDSVIGDGCSVTSSVVRGSVFEDDVDAGPFAHVRDGSHLESGVHIGTSAEVKNSRLGRDTKSGHFSYIGDARLGSNVNIGAGAVTCNFDGVNKNETIIGNDAFIGCDTMLVAPIKIGDGAVTGAGSVVTKDVPPNSLVVGVPAREQPASGRNDPK